ncbi:uncharacterized protein LOC123498640 [Portunus trituberculatus]|uniref:uncharacterized protein LOC123498640 n=1 Tax=Portunus trituberculatus TaxID=210409 RepID=UPI001E1D164B|nr:uncharacterized protein LOC123498640 [Portunus trituberculatus]XP_045101890.1 uncharacterized protein LOC123498640 [Portunus trituberculatus]
MEKNQFIRANPISIPERDLLIQLIRDEKTLENKKTDGKTILQKREAWARITRTFNSHNLGCVRSEHQLKKVWERLKVKAKHEDALMKRELKRTGDGPPPAAVSNESDQVLAILGSDIEDIGNPYDLDAMPSTAKSHRHGRLIRITKFLFGIGDSSTMVCEVVALDTPQEAMVTPQVAMVEETVMLEKTPGPTTSKSQKENSMTPISI